MAAHKTLEEEAKQPAQASHGGFQDPHNFIYMDDSMDMEWQYSVAVDNIKALPVPSGVRHSSDAELLDVMKEFKLRKDKRDPHFARVRYFRWWRDGEAPGERIPADRPHRMGLKVSQARKDNVLEVVLMDGRSLFVVGPHEAQWEVPSMFLPVVESEGNRSHHEYWYGEKEGSIKQQIWLNVATGQSTFVEPCMTFEDAEDDELVHPTTLAPAASATQPKHGDRQPVPQSRPTHSSAIPKGTIKNAPNLKRKVSHGTIGRHGKFKTTTTVQNPDTGIYVCPEKDYKRLKGSDLKEALREGRKLGLIPKYISTSWIKETWDELREYKLCMNPNMSRDANALVYWLRIDPILNLSPRSEHYRYHFLRVVLMHYTQDSPLGAPTVLDDWYVRASVERLHVKGLRAQEQFFDELIKDGGRNWPQYLSSFFRKNFKDLENAIVGSLMKAAEAAGPADQASMVIKQAAETLFRPQTTVKSITKWFMLEPNRGETIMEHACKAVSPEEYARFVAEFNRVPEGSESLKAGVARPNDVIKHLAEDFEPISKRVKLRRSFSAEDLATPTEGDGEENEGGGNGADETSGEDDEDDAGDASDQEGDSATNDDDDVDDADGEDIESRLSRMVKEISLRKDTGKRVQDMGKILEKIIAAVS